MKHFKIPILLIVAILWCNLIFGQQVPPPPPAPIQEEVFTVVEEMPRFQGCEKSQGDFSEIKKCNNEKLVQYIFANLKYPGEAKNNGVQGEVICRFVIKKDGSIGEVEILSDPGHGLGESVKQRIMSLNSFPYKWTPGKQRGKNVNVFFTIPVKFELDTNSKK